MTSDNSDYHEFTALSKSTTDPFCDGICDKFNRNGLKTENSLKQPVEVIASGVSFLISAESPLIKNMHPKRSKLTLPNVDPKCLARLLQQGPENSLEMVKEECVSLLRLALVFNLEEISRNAIIYILNALTHCSMEQIEFGYIFNSLTNDQFHLDDAVLAILDQLVTSDKTNDKKQENVISMPTLYPFPKRRIPRIAFQAGQTKTVAVEAVVHKPKYNPFDVLIAPKKTPKSQPKEPNALSSKIKAMIKPLDSEEKQKNPIKKKNPLALSVIRKVPRVKPS